MLRINELIDIPRIIRFHIRAEQFVTLLICGRSHRKVNYFLKFAKFALVRLPKAIDCDAINMMIDLFGNFQNLLFQVSRIKR
ncbi:hypothetical protein D3C84_1032550 [compost metagenome]